MLFKIWLVIDFFYFCGVKDNDYHCGMVLSRLQSCRGLLVVVDDGVHHVHHGFGGTEDGDDGVEPGVALVVLG